jgi:predicted DCC family thiol-disulfide oxidoreductase YuxK
MAPTKLTVLYDEGCAFCLRCRDWLATQPVLVDVDLLAAGSAEARERLGGATWAGKELVVLDDEGRAWTGPDAFLMCMWATARFREWAFRFNGPHLGRFAERFFLHVSKQRGRYSQWLVPPRPDCTYCDDVRIRRGL